MSAKVNSVFFVNRVPSKMIFGHTLRPECRDSRLTSEFSFILLQNMEGRAKRKFRTDPFCRKQSVPPAAEPVLTVGVRKIVEPVQLRFRDLSIDSQSKVKTTFQTAKPASRQRHIRFLIQIHNPMFADHWLFIVTKSPLLPSRGTKRFLQSKTEAFRN